MTFEPTKSILIAEHRSATPLHCCEFDPSGRFVLAGGRDRNVLCLEMSSGKTSLLAGHESWVTCAASAGTDLIVTADFTGRVIAWNCRGETPRPQWTIVAHANSIQALAVSADGRLLATGDRDGTVRVWQTSDGTRAHEIDGIGHPITALVFHPDGARLVTADRKPQKPRLIVWDFHQGQQLRTIDVPQLSAYRRYEDIEWGGIRGITISADGRILVACGSHDYSGPAAAFLFDLESGEQKRKLASSLKGFCYAVKFHAHGSLMTVAGDVGQGEFRIWDLNNDESLAVTATPGPSTDFSIHPDGLRFAVTQTVGKGAYPDAGVLSLYSWEDLPADAGRPERPSAGK